MIFKFLLQKLPVSLTVMFVIESAAATAQVYNDSGTIRVMKGSSLVSLGNFTNESGTVTNDGKIEVQGNFTNKRIYNSVNKQDSLLLSGQRTVTLLTGAVPINNLVVDKTDGGGVTLIATTTINSSFSLLKGGFSTDPEKAYELIAPASAAFTFAPGTEITGKVRRTNLANGIPVMFNQGNMSVTINAGIPPATLLVNMVPGVNPSSGREVKRYFRFSPTGGINYTADITFPYNVAELNSNSEANLVGWYKDGTGNWKQKLTGNDVNASSHFVASAGIKAALLENQEWKLEEMEYDARNPNFFVYPIPAKNSLNILLTAEKNKTVTIELLDVSGRACKTLQKEIEKGLNKIALNITTLNSGQYILKVAEGKSVQTKVVLID